MSQMMRAAVLHGPGHLKLQTREAPCPAPGQALVAVEAVGLCGSDLHYYADGRNGSNVIHDPAVLGHEIGGTIIELGSGVPSARVGERVVVEPAVPCQTCSACAGGRYNLCPHGVCLGSPPTDGGLAEYLAVPAAHLHPTPPELAAEAVPVLEPLAVAIHALRRAEFSPGESVLVTGAGPIGLLVAQVALAWHAREITVSDVDPVRLQAAQTLGITHTALADELGDLRVDRALECSGAAEALPGALEATTPGGRVVLVGTNPSGDHPVPLSLLQRFEVDLVGTFRYARCFPEAVELVGRGMVDVASLVTASFPLWQADQAFAHAASGAGLKTTMDCTRATPEPQDSIQQAREPARHTPYGG